MPDHNRNYNGMPDYVEPFLMYDADPQDYDYGADLNHNDFIDARENDWEADYPYDPDLRGLHLYGQLQTDAGSDLDLGGLTSRANRWVLAQQGALHPSQVRAASAESRALLLRSLAGKGGGRGGGSAERVQRSCAHRGPAT